MSRESQVGERIWRKHNIDRLVELTWLTEVTEILPELGIGFRKIRSALAA